MARIQGITIELGADASGIEQALKDVNKASNTTTKELGQINRALKFDPDNVNLLSQKFEVLQDSIGQTETKLSALREAQAEVNRQFQAGEIDARAYRAFNREIEQTEGRLRALRAQADDVQVRLDVQADTTGIEKMKAAMKELGPAAKQAGKEIADGLSKAAAAGTAAVTGLVVGMADTNKDLAMLETQIGQVGLALDDIGNARTTFDSVGQETDQVTEAMGNLIQAGYDTKDSIDDISTSLAGAIVKYGDTFNVEGLAESITTTTQLG